jgi:hypothetical protein
VSARTTRHTLRTNTVTPHRAECRNCGAIVVAHLVVTRVVTGAPELRSRIYVLDELGRPRPYGSSLCPGGPST